MFKAQPKPKNKTLTERLSLLSRTGAARDLVSPAAPPVQAAAPSETPAPSSAPAVASPAPVQMSPEDEGREEALAALESRFNLSKALEGKEKV